MSVLGRSVLAVATGVTLLATAATPATAQPAEGAVRSAGGATAVADSYLVVFKDSAVGGPRVGGTARALAGRHQGTVARSYQAALRGFEFRGGERAARRIAADPSVAYVQQNHRVRIAGEQTNPPAWGLDRVNQRDLPLDNRFSWPRSAGAVRVYVLDTGLRFSHAQLGGRATSGFDAVDGGSADDCNGHGTHVAGTIGGTSYGVAKGVRMVAVRVLDCRGSGTWAGVIAGIDWVTANAVKPAVANMSLGGEEVQAVDDAVRNSIRSGITYSLAAGNGDQFGNRQDACGYSPARTAEAITVGATDRYDTTAFFSNYGSCVDILAPGVDIASAWHTGDQATMRLNGTSMAAPHVAGAAALILASHPTWTPQQVRDRLVADATTGRVSDVGLGTPNTLLFVQPAPSRDSVQPRPGDPVRPRPVPLSSRVASR